MWYKLIVFFSQLQPFWPSGTGCNRGFLGVFDAAWLFKGFCSEGADLIQLLEERETIMTIFPQVHMASLQKDVDRYTIDPKTRYKGLRSLKPRMDVKQLYDTDTLPKTIAVGRVGKSLLIWNMAKLIWTMIFVLKVLRKLAYHMIAQNPTKRRCCRLPMTCQKNRMLPISKKKGW